MKKHIITQKKNKKKKTNARLQAEEDSCSVIESPIQLSESKGLGKSDAGSWKGNLFKLLD